MSESIHIEELRKEIENLCGNCDRPDKEELGKIILSSMALGFNEGLKVSSADRPQWWIPCSERLPEEKEVVAVIIKRWDTGEIKKGITYRVDRNMWVGFGRHNKACVWWLPLPPWKGDNDE